MTAGSNTAAERAREHYDSLSFLYRLLWGEHLHHGLFQDGWETPRAAQLNLVRYCSSLLDVQRSRRVLDVGCGYGRTTIHLAQRYGCSATGLTISAVQARVAVQRAYAAGVADSVAFVVCDAECHDLGNSTYDIVWVMEAAEHFCDRETFFRRAAAALDHRGKLLLCCWAARSPTPQLRGLADLCACPEFQTLHAYLEQITAAGLRTQYAEELTASVARTWDIVQRRASFLRPTLRLWPRVVQQFACAVGELRRAFHSRELQYWVVAATKC